MATSPKALFETVASHGLGDKQVKSSVLGAVFRGVQESINELKNSSSDCDTPYSLVVGEIDSNNLYGVEATQILETVSLRDSKGDSLGSVRFESGNGIGVALSNRYSDTIYIHGGQLQGDIKKNANDISEIYSDLLGQIKDLQDEVQLLKNILEDESVAKGKGTN
jgi:hypothetical protein